MSNLMFHAPKNENYNLLMFKLRQFILRIHSESHCDLFKLEKQ